MLIWTDVWGFQWGFIVFPCLEYRLSAVRGRCFALHSASCLPVTVCLTDCPTRNVGKTPPPHRVEKMADKR